MDTRRHSLELRRALAALASKHFFGAITLRMDIREDRNVKTGTADGNLIRYNPRWFNALPFEQQVGWLAQKGLQCASRHHLRMIDRDTDIVNIASQLVVNPQLLEDGFELPDGFLFAPQYTGMSFERVCNLLELEQEQQQQQSQSSGEQQDDSDDQAGSGQDDAGEDQGDSDGDDQDDAGEDGTGEGDSGEDDGTPGSGTSAVVGGDGDADQADYGNCGSIQAPRDEHGNPCDSAELGQQKSLWEAAVREAELVTRRIGDLPGSALTLSRYLTEGQQDWREIMKRFLYANTDTDYSWMKADRRFATRPPYGDFIPDLQTDGMEYLLIGIDMSGSVMTKRQIEIITAELNTMVGEAAPKRIVVVGWDTIVQRIDEYSVHDLPLDMYFQGQGGTKCSAFFEWVEDQGINPVCAVVFSDLEINDFPYTDPAYPVLWASTNKPSAPFGEVVMLDGI